MLSLLQRQTNELCLGLFRRLRRNIHVVISPTLTVHGAAGSASAVNPTACYILMLQFAIAHNTLYQTVGWRPSLGQLCGLAKVVIPPETTASDAAGLQSGPIARSSGARALDRTTVANSHLNLKFKDLWFARNWSCAR